MGSYPRQSCILRVCVLKAHLYGEDGRTEYSRRRGRRAAASRFGSRIEDSFSFVTCKCYHGGVTLAGSGAPKTQPFRVTVSAAASLVCSDYCLPRPRTGLTH